MDNLVTLAGLAWDPEIRGILVVATGFAVLMGSIWLIMATNSGVRLATLLDIPDLAFLDLEGQRSPLLPGRGRSLLVNLWASWCIPCLEELREFRERGDELKKAGVEILARWESVNLFPGDADWR